MKCINLNIKIFIFLFIILILIVTFLYFNKNENTKFNIEKNEVKIYQEEICEDDKKIDNYLLHQYKTKKLVALTFDDGPSKYTADLLEVLYKKDVKATFFLIGDNIKSHKDIISLMNNYNNEIAIHSYVHKLFTKIKDSEIHEQIELTKSEILSLTNTKINLIRVPYGALSDRVLNVISNENLTSVLWDVDSLDWKLKNTDKIYKYVLKNFKGNQIILMHDTYKTSIEAAIKLIDTLKQDGYTFVTVSELLKLKNCSN